MKKSFFCFLNLPSYGFYLYSVKQFFPGGLYCKVKKDKEKLNDQIILYEKALGDAGKENRKTTFLTWRNLWQKQDLEVATICWQFTCFFREEIIIRAKLFLNCPWEILSACMFEKMMDKSVLECRMLVD